MPLFLAAALVAAVNLGRVAGPLCHDRAGPAAPTRSLVDDYINSPAYVHQPAVSSEADLSPAVNHSDVLMIQWINDVGSTDYYNILTQYSGAAGQGPVQNAAFFGGSYVDNAPTRTRPRHPHRI